MNVINTTIDGVVIIEPRIFEDGRGYFFESFSLREFDEKVAPILGHTVTFVQDNESKSSYGVMRGLHFQRPPFTQSKLVRCVKGAVLDVAVDIRKGSPTYGQHVECLLCAQEVYDCPKTVISREYSTEYKPGMEPYYTVNDDRNNALADQYRALAAQEPNVIFGGRLAEYKYYDMAPIVEEVFKMDII